MATTIAPVVLTLCAIANISIGAYVLCRNPRSSTHRAFFLYAVPIGIWAFAVALTHSTTTPAVWHVRLAFSAGSLVPIAMLTFAEHFRSGKSSSSPINRWMFAPLGLGFCLLSWSPWLAVGVILEGGHIRPTYGPLHVPFAVYILGCFAYGIYVLLQAYRSATGLLKLQTRYLLIAMAMPIAPALI